jgi:hypothetical protein
MSLLSLISDSYDYTLDIYTSIIYNYIIYQIIKLMYYLFNNWLITNGLQDVFQNDYCENDYFDCETEYENGLSVKHTIYNLLFLVRVNYIWCQNKDGVTEIKQIIYIYEDSHKTIIHIINVPIYKNGNYIVESAVKFVDSMIKPIYVKWYFCFNINETKLILLM